MATPGEHNQIIKCVFDGNKHLKHVLSDQEIIDLTMIEQRFPLTKLPVCGHCERLGFWHKDLNGKPIGYCKKCGTITKKPITYATYLASKMDVDATGETFRSMLLAEKAAEEYKRMVYLPDNSRMEALGK
jgi:hypothetical protein